MSTALRLHGDAQMATRRSMQTWERAEIVRSTVEATLTADEALHVSPATMKRYEAPPAATSFPLEYAYHVLGNVTGLRIVDFGCGSGANTILLVDRGAQVWGVDISEELIRLAQRRLEVNGRAGAAQFIVASAHDLPFLDASIDVVFGIAILHHLDLRLVSREVHRILRPGGRAIFQEPVRNSKLIRFVRALIPYHAPDVSPFERPLTDRELERFAQPFAAMRLRPFLLPHVQLASVLPLVKDRIHPLYHSDAALLRAIPALRHFAGIRVMELMK